MRLGVREGFLCGRALTTRPSSSTLCFRPVSSRLNSSNARRQSSSSSIFAITSQEGTAEPKPFYITTPIFYVNASPHVGHLHSLVLSDVLARYSRLRYPQRRVLFSTGTDEHGLKIQQAAKAQGVDEQAFCDAVSQRFRDLSAQANCSHTTFIRTSSPHHHAAVEHFWTRLVDSGDIYKGTHSGWYSISDECFYSASQVTERDGKMVATESGNEVTWEEETNWKFRLGRFKDKLKEWASRPGAIQPMTYQQEVLSQLDTLDDLSISRPASRVRWGVPVPNDPEQTIYVWVDALINYATVVGYPGPMDGWPADVHLVGKDIIKFHAIHWPALLMAAHLPTPRHVLAHAHWTMAKSKMSKSRGNVVDPVVSMRKWGVDAVRWYLMRIGGGLPVDSDYSEDELGVQYRLLADQMGNLLSRISSPRLVAKMVAWQNDRDRDGEMDVLLDGMKSTYEGRMESVGISRACEGVMEVVQAANRLITASQPWAKSTPSSTQSLAYAYTSLRLAGILLQPIMPSKSAELLDRLGVRADARTWENVEWTSKSVVDVQAIKEGLSGDGNGNGKKGGVSLFPPVEPAAGAQANS